MPVAKHIPAAAVPMGPPMARPRMDNRLKDDMKFFKQLDSFDAELKSMQVSDGDSQECISRRKYTILPMYGRSTILNCCAYVTQIPTQIVYLFGC